MTISGVSLRFGSVARRSVNKSGADRRRVSTLRLVEDKTAVRQRARSEAITTEYTGRRDAKHLTVLVASFVGFGLVMVLSASPVISIANYGSPWSLFERQAMWSIIGVFAFFVTTRLPLARWRRVCAPLLLATTFLLLIVLAPHVGPGNIGGSSRWIGFGQFRIQPSEFAKLSFAIFAADLLARRPKPRNELAEVVRPLALVLAVMGILILKQPDMGTAVVLVCIATAILYTGGIRGRLLGASMGLLGVTGAILAMSAPYRRARLLSFVNPFAHASTTGYQVVQGLVALGSGHLTGTGIGGSAAAWGFLPNAQTDFIFAIIGNELGLVGAAMVLLGFGFFGWIGIRIAARAEDRFAGLLAAGITCWIACQAFINIGGVVGVLPETGIPLPFLSFGGSSLVVVLAATGMLTNIAKNPRDHTDASIPQRRLSGGPRPTKSARLNSRPR